jgi:hypothetical protein
MGTGHVVPFPPKRPSVPSCIGPPDSAGAGLRCLACPELHECAARRAAKNGTMRLADSPCAGCPSVGLCWEKCLHPERLKVRGKPALTRKPAPLLPFAPRPVEG